VVSALASINEVKQRRAQLVLKWVTVSGEGHLSRYVTSHPGRLSLTIPSWVGAMSISQRAVMPCGWGVKAGMVCGWQVKLCDPVVTRGPYLSALEIRSLYMKRYINSPSLLYFTLLYRIELFFVY